MTAGRGEDSALEPTDRAGLPRLLDSAGVAEALRISERHVRRLVSERRIPFLKLGREVRFEPGEICAWLEERRVAPVNVRLRANTRGVR